MRLKVFVIVLWPSPVFSSNDDQLIQELYRPGAQISKIQEMLQRLQRSTAGWQLGSDLLRSNDEKVQFFGALTFTVKLNSDSYARLSFPRHPC